jgi:pimeloyl-ACP methyl ester carboxylesterase
LTTKEGAQRTHQLSGLFASHFDRPERTYLMGHSLGAVIAVSLAEKHPTQYAGALAMCGQLGGIQASADYFAHVRVLFDYFYPGILPGDALHIPATFDLNADVVLPAVQAMQMSPTGAGAIARLMLAQGMPVPFATGPQLVQSIVTALAFGFRALPDLLERTHGRSPFDNSLTVYAAPGLPTAMLADLNEKVDRFSSTPDAANYLRHYYEPTGGLRVPVLTLSNALDPVSAPFHEPMYGATLPEAGAAELLVQRKSVNLYGHCNLTTSEIVQAFTDLVGWVGSGVKPVA